MMHGIGWSSLLLLTFLCHQPASCRSNITFEVDWYDGRNHSMEYLQVDYGDCLFTKEPDTIYCMKKYTYKSITDAWKYESNSIKYISVNCLSQENFRTHRHTCLCTKSSDAANPSISRQHDAFYYCHIYRLFPRMFQNLENLEVIDLSNNSISLVQIDAFEGVSSLLYLDLSENPFDALPGSMLCDASALQVLIIRRSQLRTFPAQLFDCKSTSGIKYIDMSDGIIDNIPMTTFRNLPDLQSLNLSGNAIGQILHSTFEPLRALQYLDFSSNNFTAFPNGLCEPLKQLVHLKLHKNKLTTLDFTGIHDCQNLTYLDFSDNRITSLQPDILNGSYAIKHLDLHSNAVGEIPDAVFEPFKDLEYLDISNNNLHILHNNSFAGLHNLKTLHLSGNNIEIMEAPKTNYFLHHLHSLTTLFLDSNAIKFVPEGMFENMTRLEYLDLSKNQISNEMTHSFKMLIFLKHLDLSHNLISSVPNLFFASMATLETVDLSYNQIVSFDNCLLPISLLEVNLLHNAIREFPDSFGSTSVKRLNLRKNKITVLQEKRMKNMSSLEYLDLSENEINFIEDNSFSHMTNILHLHLSHNKLNQSFANATIFYGANNLVELDMSNNFINNINGLINPEQLLNLTVLILDYNNIQNVGKLLLEPELEKETGGSKLNTISLIACGIEQIDPNTFQNMANLKTVHLGQNQIQEFAPFSSSWHAEYYLAGNPLLCSCTMNWLKRGHLTIGSQQISTYHYHMTNCDVIAHGYSMPVHRVPQKDFLCTTKQECDSLCTCYSRTRDGPVQTVKCNGMLSRLPEYVSSWSKFVYLDGNRIRKVVGDVTRGVMMLTLEMYMNMSGIENIHVDFFNNFVNLEVLDLSFNKLADLEPLQFQHLTHLRRLNLSSNFLTTLNKNVFIGLERLLRLDLSNNEIQVFDGNALTQMSTFHVPFLVYLGSNPYSCVCPNNEFVKWIKRYRSMVADRRDLYCKKTNEDRQYLLFADSFCAPRQSLNTLTTGNTKNIIITCVILIVLLAFVLAVLYYYRRDIVAYFYIKFHCGCLRTKFDNSKLYDAFVIYDTNDSAAAAWTTDIMIYRLQKFNKPKSYRVIVPDKMKALEGVGELESHQIYDCKTAVFVITPNFSGNNWSVECFRKALSFRNENNLFKIIIVTLGKVQWDFLEPEMKIMFQKGRYITGRSRTLMNRLVYELPNPGLHGGLVFDDTVSETDVIIYDVIGGSIDDPGRVYINT